MHLSLRARALLRLPSGIIRAALVVRIVDEWWSYLPAGSIADLRRDLGVTYAQAGWLLALLTVGGVVGGPLGAIADRGHRRLLAVSGATVLAGGLSVYALGPPFVVLALASVALGMASDLLIRPLEGSLAEMAGADLDRMLGRQHLLTWAGDFVGPALLAVGAATFIGWRGAFALTAVAIASHGAVLAFTEFPDPAPAEDDEPGLWRSAMSLVRSREVLLLGLAEAMLLPLDEAFLGFAVARAGEAGRTAAAQLLAGGLVVGGLLGAGAVSRWGLVRHVRRWGGPLLAAGTVATAAGPGLWWEAVALIAMGGGTAIVWAGVHHRMLTAVPGRSSTVPTIVSAISTPSLLIPAGVGWVADRTTITIGLLVCAVTVPPLLAAVAALGDGRRSPLSGDA